MHDERVGRLVRAVRRRNGWRQRDLGERVGCSQRWIAEIELGRLDAVSVGMLRRVGDVLEIRMMIDAWWRRGDGAKLLDAAHADLVERTLQHLIAAGWMVVPEWSFNHFGERGSVDIVAWHAATRTLLIVEVKTRIDDVQELLHTFGRKVRIAPNLLAAERGWMAERVAPMLVIGESHAARTIVRQHRATFDSVWPEGTVACKRFITDTSRTAFSGGNLVHAGGGAGNATGPPEVTIGGLVSRALDLAFPGTCVGCGTEGEPLCAGCTPGLDVRLAAPAGVPIGLPGEIPAPLLQLEWCAPFQGVARDALHAIKYGGEQRLAGPLGAAIARRWARAGSGATIVTHVPVHADRARQRGYDQAELIARSAARHLGLPQASLLVRARATIAQFDLDRADRAHNVHDAFALRTGPPAGSTGATDSTGTTGTTGATDIAVGPLHGQWILLIDDVVTTGATLAACATVLVRAGALGVSAITVARER